MIIEQLILQQNVAYDPGRHSITKHTGGGGEGGWLGGLSQKSRHIYPRTAILKKCKDHNP